MTSVTRLVTFTVISLFCVTPHARAQQNTGVIEGRVVDAGSGEPLPGAKIVVT